MIITKITGALFGVVGIGTVAFQALDFSPCSTYEASIVNQTLREGDRVFVRFDGNRRVEGCRVLVDYRIFDGGGVEIFSWHRDVKSPGPAGPFVWTVPLPIAVPATPGPSRIDIAISHIKNPVQQVLYEMTGWTTTVPPIELDFTIEPKENPA
jgi:hypothetical protein